MFTFNRNNNPLLDFYKYYSYKGFKAYARYQFDIRILQ